jgi:nucleotide-binding universal stress UspA family protein
MPKILITIDFSEQTRAALEFGNKLCQWSAREDCEVVLLTVLEDLAQKNIHFQFALAMLEGHGIREELLVEATEKLNALAKEYFPEVNVKTSVVQATKPAHLEIADYAIKEGSDLLIAARPDRGGVSQVIMGSILEKLVREAPCPTIIVPQQKSSDEKTE